jgi:transcriptional regulator GlxA family with amidase domain
VTGLSGLALAWRPAVNTFGADIAIANGIVEGARIDAARRLLEETTNPLKRVAAWSGFGNPNGLRRAFQRRLGVTPGDYRSRFRNAAN